MVSPPALQESDLLHAGSLQQNYPGGSHAEGLPLRLTARRCQPAQGVNQPGLQATGVETLSRRRITHNRIMEKSRMGDGMNDQCLRRTQQHVWIGGWSQSENCDLVVNSPALARRLPGIGAKLQVRDSQWAGDSDQSRKPLKQACNQPLVLLPQVTTCDCTDPVQPGKVIADESTLAVKQAAGAGAVAMLIGPQMSEEELGAMEAKIR